MTRLSSLQRMRKEFGAEFWNDSCHPDELQNAIEQGAVGATSNPVIVAAVLKEKQSIWASQIDQMIQENPSDSEDGIAWRVIEMMGVQAAELLRPIFEETEGRSGRLSIQVNPKDYRSSQAMVTHALRLAQTSPNIAIKLPSTAAGIAAMEELTARGITVNATVSFSISQMVCTAEAIEKGLKRCTRLSPTPYITLMVGRLDDHLKRSAQATRLSGNLEVLDWAGIAVAKKAFQLFQERQFKSRVLIAAYRHSRHWSELIGSGIIQTIPYTWWKKFLESGAEIGSTLANPVPEKTLQDLYKIAPDFRKAYEVGAIRPEEFVSFGATVHTLHQFLDGYQDLVKMIRAQMLGRSN